MRYQLILLAVASMAAAPGLAQTGDAARGKTLYESRCGACHSLDSNRVGPLHMGLFGRKAGSVPDYDYSDAVKKSKVVWNDKTLDQWLAFPENLIAGQKMGFYVQEAQDRADLIAYLKVATVIKK